MDNEYIDLFGSIPEFKNWKEISRINKGWSTDEKFFIKNMEGKQFLLRLNNISEFDKKKSEFDAIKLITSTGINMSKPIDFGTCCNNKNVYMLLTWIEGESAEEALPKLSENEQYKLGIKAGIVLRKIHLIPIESVVINCEETLRKKVETKMLQYKDCGIKVPNDKKFLEFILKNIGYLRDIKQTIRHGDYHVGNIIITQDRKIGVIDFNRFDFGDPWKEFNRLMTFSRKISIPFAKGQIDGYFTNEVPDLFFKLSALYTAYDSLFSIISTIPFGGEDIKNTICLSKMIFDDYNGFDSYIPKWYK
ncbi:phosphotransferase (plasmid) [Clostridium estertheticum]|uniref:aminoglycoside phosphotransferase family protein n=1 Tax=Clostridium estertheticum TaxID=238834 RepID=UPI001C7D0314|nr:phosphotransferase [Clostridium estertheticum]MBX4262857.1 phosphotransferase [Clostridium estertheticum]WLC73212.1 phosphotransferase [Clostridium estertheticum]